MKKSNRIIILCEDITNKSFLSFDKKLRKLEKTKEPITLRINSSGGSFYDSLAIVERIRLSPCKINTEVFGRAFSGAFLIFIHGDYRTMTRNSWLMFHSISVETLSGKAHEISSDYKQIELEVNQLCSLVSDRSSRDYDFWLSLAKKSDFYMSSEKALDLGLVDKILK